MEKTKNSQKKLTSRRFAPIGLWVSGIAFIITVLLAIVKVLSLAKIYTLPNSQTFTWMIWISSGLIFLGLAAFALLDPQRVRELLTGRQARYGSNAAIMLLAFLGILLVINVLVFQNQGKPLDLTEDKQNSLAPETLNALKAISSPVHATAFFTTQTNPATAQKLLDEYKANSKGLFTFEFINPDQNPLLAQHAGITGDGKIYLQMGTDHEIVATATEQDMTTGLIKLLNPSKQTIYFLTGHGERDIQNAGNPAYTLAKAALEAKNYTIQSLNLIAENKIPTDAKVIVVAGPTVPISPTEGSLLQDYVAKGGGLIVMMEPTPLTQFGTSADPLAAFLATDWGVTFDNDIVIDTNSNQPLYAVAAAYANHAITQKLQGLVSFYPNARSISISSTAANAPTGLVATTSSAWGETDFSTLQTTGQATFKQGVDIPGPLTLIAVAENTTTGSHIVAIGDVDFASDAFFNQYANGDLFLNTVDWAAGQEKLINLTAPKTITRSLILPSSFWLLVMAISLLLILPGLVVAGGVISWLIRRSRG
jgi:ABC-type uncharacterized transport system involved in gliding motility auxiliary subunit